MGRSVCNVTSTRRRGHPAHSRQPLDEAHSMKRLLYCTGRSGGQVLALLLAGACGTPSAGDVRGRHGRTVRGAPHPSPSTSTPVHGAVLAAAAAVRAAGMLNVDLA